MSDASIDPETLSEFQRLFGAKSQSEPDLVKISQVLEWNLTDTVESVIVLAKDLHHQSRAREPLNSSFLIFAMICHGRNNIHERYSTAFLANLIYPDFESNFENCQQEYFRKVRERWAGVSDDIVTFVSPGLLSDLQHAQGIGDRLGNSEINARQLLASILLYREHDGEIGALKRLQEIGLDTKKLQIDFGRLMIREAPEQERSVWLELFPEQPFTSTRNIAEFNSDVTAGVDQLDILRDVSAMASLIASKALHPPLSIGLFGHWGSGKTFFMNRMQEAIEDIASDAAVDGEIGRHYWRRIVHVRFNAWNYVDANLWASLVSHLFACLSCWEVKEANSFEHARRDAIGQLQLAQEARHAAEAKSKEAEIALKQAKDIKGNREDAVNQDRAALVKAIQRDIWAAVGEKLSCPTEELKKHLEHVGISVSNLKESAQQVHDHVREATTLAGRLRILCLILTTDPKLFGHLALTIFGCVVVLILAFVFVDHGQTLIALLTGVAGEAAVLVGGLASWIRRGAEEVAKIMKPVYQLRTELDRALRTTENEKTADIARLQSQLEQRQAEYEVAVRELDKATVAVQAAAAALTDVQSGKLISRFIEERVASGDYRRHLGIIAMIRDDLAKLNDLISGYNDYLRNQDHESTSSEHQAAPDGKLKMAEPLGINRIVLYIDDLDRCPPARVVEVLQAIHLLLAFPLFVVVVAVDARWVSRALQDQYPHLLTESTSLNYFDARSSANTQNTAPAASPQDYLEKIFQVPFWVQPMHHEGCRNLIGHLTSSSIAAHKPVPSAGNQLPPANEPPAVHAARQLHQNSTHVPVSAGLRSTEKLPLDNPQLHEKPKPEAIRLEEWEVVAMKDLAPLIGRSPREVKRFVNVYRLLKAAVPNQDLRDFIGTSLHPGNFRFPMLLLSVTSGMPRSANTIIRKIREVATPMEGSGSKVPSLGDTVDAAIAEMPEMNPHDGPSDLHRLGQFLSANAIWAKLSTGKLKKWIGRVAQFTFEQTAESWF